MKISYRDCMDTCIEYVTTIYQSEEEEAILYCRQTCIELKQEPCKKKVLKTI